MSVDDEGRELYAPVVTKFKKRRIVARGIDDVWGCDLLDLPQFVDQNNGFRYVLDCVDVVSKMVFAEPIRRKTAAEVKRAFERILTKSKRQPHKLHVDQGTEFWNGTLMPFLKKKGILMYHTHSKEKSAIIERFHRTLNRRLKLHFPATGKEQWKNILPRLISDYNNRVHSVTKMTPIEGSKKKNEKLILSRIYKDPEVIRKPKLKVGDRVRIFRYKEKFANKFTRNWTREIFHIVEVHLTDPITYSVADAENERITGKYYTQELLKTRF